VNPYLPDADAEGFDVAAYVKERLAGQDFETVFGNPVLRRAITRQDPILFALTYLPHHLRSEATGDRITFSSVHFAWARYILSWTRPYDEETGPRDAFIAPREMGKSTWMFLIAPMFAGAHGHVGFVAAFADSGSQAETHLATFKHELETNALLRADFPELCSPMVRNRGTTAADRQGMYQSSNGFVFAARGVDSSSLGLKVGSKRPDLIILDDIEPDEAKYSADLKKKRLSTLLDAILPLNTAARVAVTGTVTMAGSIIHELSKHALGKETTDWIASSGFRAHHFLPIVTDDEGRERSVWPARWSLAWLNSIRTTRQYLKNYANDPRGADGDYWNNDTFIEGDVKGITRTALSIDPAVTANKGSDFTGLAVVGYSPSEGKCLVKHASQVKLTPANLRRHVMKLLDEFPEVRLILIETNQGGDAWKAILHSMPVKVAIVHQSEKKEVRAAEALNFYELGKVVHVEGLTAAEEQMASFPLGPHDDIVDAITTIVRRFLDPPKRATATSSAARYRGR
jgi:predicted phage terminase large subunit-like protein